MNIILFPTVYKWIYHTFLPEENNLLHYPIFDLFIVLPMLFEIPTLQVVFSLKNNMPISVRHGFNGTPLSSDLHKPQCFY